MSKRCDYRGPSSCGQIIRDDAEACYLHIDDLRAEQVGRRAVAMGGETQTVTRSGSRVTAQQVRSISVPSSSAMRDSEMAHLALMETTGMDSATVNAVQSSLATLADDYDSAVEALSTPQSAADAIARNSAFSRFANALQERTEHRVSCYGLSGMHRMKRNGLFQHDPERTHMIAVLPDENLVIDPFSSLLAPVSDLNRPAYEQANGWSNPLFVTPLCVPTSFYREPYSYVWFDSIQPIDF